MAKKNFQAFADSLGVSRITVWKALNNRPGVSAGLREHILQAAAERGIIEGEGLEKPRKRMISVAVSRPDSSQFWLQIIHHIAKELSLYDIDLMYTYLPSSVKEHYALPASLREVSAFIVLNVYDAGMLRLLAALPQPKVFLDTVPSLPFEALNGNLLLLEGRRAVGKITGRLLDSGRSRLGFIGDALYAQTNLDRYQGFLDAHAARGLKPDAGCLLTGPLGVRTHGEEIYSFLDGLEALPQGVVCASDYVAHFVARDVEEHKDRAPAGFVVTGYDDSDEYGNIAGRITSVGVQTAFLGSRLARQALFLSDYPSATHEVSYVDAEVIFRGALQ